MNIARKNVNRREEIRCPFEPSYIPNPRINHRIQKFETVEKRKDILFSLFFFFLFNFLLLYLEAKKDHEYLPSPY